MIRFNSKSKFENAVVALALAGPKDGIVNKIMWTVMMYLGAFALMIKDLFKKRG